MLETVLTRQGVRGGRAVPDTGRQSRLFNQHMRFPPALEAVLRDNIPSSNKIFLQAPRPLEAVVLPLQVGLRKDFNAPARRLQHRARANHDST